MDWRTWVHATLVAAPAVTQSVPAVDIIGSGSAVMPKRRPCIVIRMEEDGKAFRGAESARNRQATIWVHDDFGSFLRIDAILGAIKLALEGAPAAPGVVCAEWQGDSIDLNDADQGTLVRNSSFKLVAA